MSDPHPNLRAAVDAILPGGSSPGALDAGADRLVADTLERMGEEAAQGVPFALDLFAGDERPFAELSLEDRIGVMRAMQRSGDPQLAGVVRLLFTLTMAAVYSDAADGPVGWDAVGYPGPATAYDLPPFEAP